MSSLFPFRHPSFHRSTSLMLVLLIAFVPLLLPYGTAIAADTLVALGTVGENYDQAHAVNNLGQVVGVDVVSFGPTTQVKPFLYSNGQLTYLGSLGGSQGGARDINDLGQIVGSSMGSDGYSRAFLYQNGQMSSLGLFGAATSINEIGQVVGFYSDSPQSPQKGFLYDNGQVIDIVGVDGTIGYPEAINDLGQIVGATVSSGYGRVFLYQNGQMTMIDLSPLGGIEGAAYDINNLGQIVGTYRTATGDDRAFLYDNGHLSNLGTFGGATGAQGINDFSQIVGYSFDAQGQQFPFVYQKGKMTALSILTPFRSVAVDINERSQAVGASNGVGVLWTVSFPPPVPEEEIAAIKSDVNNLVSKGALNQGQGNALRTKLDAANKTLNEGNKTATINLLQAFINQVEGLVEAGRLSSADGNVLISAANDTIALLRG